VKVTQSDSFEIRGREYCQYAGNRQCGAAVDSFNQGMGMGTADYLGKYRVWRDDIGCISSPGQGSLPE
jgi:hypothetical protein